MKQLFLSFFLILFPFFTLADLPLAGKGADIKDMTEFEKQQKILEQFKPLIAPRTYAELFRIRFEEPNLKLNRLPELGEAIVPGRAPNAFLTPYLLKSFAHPAYVSEFQNLEYIIAVSCEDPWGFDDCSTTPHNQFRDKPVYVRFIQSSDRKFNQVKGMSIGDSFASVSHLFVSDARIMGDGECIQTQTTWVACFDATQLAVDRQRLQMMPAAESRLTRFLKVSGRGY